MDDIKNIINKVIGDIAEKTPDTHNKIERIWQKLLTEARVRTYEIVGSHRRNVVRSCSIHRHGYIKCGYEKQRF